jgi:hypothetical protein
VDKVETNVMGAKYENNHQRRDVGVGRSEEPAKRAVNAKSKDSPHPSHLLILVSGLGEESKPVMDLLCSLYF